METKQEICPQIKNCSVPVTKKEFISECCNNWKECFLNASKLPSEWLEELNLE